MRTGAALSRLAEARPAGVDAATQARARMGGAEASLCVLFASSHFTDGADGVLDGVHEAVGNVPTVGCVAESVIANETEAEGEPSVAVWLGSLDEAAPTFAVEFARTEEGGGAFAGLPADAQGTFVLIADPFSFPTDVLLRHLNGRDERPTLIGGMAGGSGGPGGTRLFLDDRVVATGAVAARLPDCVDVLTVVSQGCRPIGSPFTVTRAEENVIFELGGRPPVERLQEMFAGLAPDDQELVTKGLLLGRVIDEYKTEFERGDFLVRGVMGADPATGAIAVGDHVHVGEAVQFHVRDAATADEDLAESLGSLRTRLGGREAAGVLLFTCNGRGLRLFDRPSHDAGMVSDELDGVPLAGFFAAGEVGPVGGRSFLHGFTASMAVFAEPQSSR